MKRLSLVLALVLLAVLWGVAFVAIKQALREMTPVNLTIIRFAVADVFLLALLAARPSTRPRFGRADLGRLAVLGVTGVPIYHFAINWGEHRTSASVAALVVATAPVMVAVLSSLALGERVTAFGVVGIALAFGGVVLLSFRGQEDGTETQLAGFLVALLSPLAWAVYTVVAKPLTARAPAIHVTIAGMLLGSLMLLPFIRPTLFAEIAALSLEGWLWVLWLGAGGSVAGYLLFTWALSRADATKVGVSLYMVPVVALLSAWAILDEPLGAIVGVAAALVIVGVVITQQAGVRARIPPPAEEPVVIDRAR